MSILIKGMEMPDNCNSCPFSVNGFCVVSPKRANGEAMSKRTTTNWCPLIEIPPHGRLVDADAYAQEIRERHESASEWYKKATDDEILARAESAMITFTECFLTLKKMSTVIPAEESE